MCSGGGGIGVGRAPASARGFDIDPANECDIVRIIVGMGLIGDLFPAIELERLWRQFSARHGSPWTIVNERTVSDFREWIYPSSMRNPKGEPITMNDNNEAQAMTQQPGIGAPAAATATSTMPTMTTSPVTGAVNATAITTRYNNGAFSQATLDNMFSYHAPKSDQQARYVLIRDTAKLLAEVITRHCPPSADTTASIRLLRECVMTANMSIACGE